MAYFKAQQFFQAEPWVNPVLFILALSDLIRLMDSDLANPWAQ
jgi:hypothetical protein